MAIRTDRLLLGRTSRHDDTAQRQWMLAQATPLYFIKIIRSLNKKVKNISHIRMSKNLF